MAEDHAHSTRDERWDWADRDTLLDITVNLVPVVILLFFIVFYTVVRPWEWDPLMFVVMHFLTAFPLVLVLLLTYVSARAISRDESRAHEMTTSEETGAPEADDTT